MQSVHLQMRAGEWAMLMSLALIWGCSFFFIGVAVKVLPPFTLVMLRVGIAALALCALIFAAGQRVPLTARTVPAFLLLGFLNNALPFSLISWGQTHIGSGLASILNATTPLFTLVIAHQMTHDEKMTPRRIAGVVLGILGILVMVGGDALHGLSGGVLGQLAVLAGAASYGFGGVTARHFQRLGLRPLQLAAGTMGGSTILLIPLVIAFDRPWLMPLPGWSTWGAVLGLSLMCTALAYILYFRVLATAGAVNIALVTFLVPVTAVFLGAAFLHESLQLKQFIGMGFIGLGVLVIDGRILGPLRRFAGARGQGDPRAG